MVQFFLEDGKVRSFVEHLQNRMTVYAPHKKGQSSYAFAEVKEAGNVVLDYPRSLHSVKKYFLPPREELLSFSIHDNSFEVTQSPPSNAIFFGVHSYDMQAVLKLDHNLSQGNAESNYISRRQGSIFVGVSFKPDKYHFSASVGIDPFDMTGFDLFLSKIEEGYILSVVSDEGADLVGGFQMPEYGGVPGTTTGFHQHVYAPQSKLSLVFDQSYDHEVWEEVSEQCVGCGTCNLVCPTCYCFDVDDTVDITVTSGSRERNWDGCMIRDFSSVAGGEVFREKLSARQRHRVYRKFKYISDDTGEPWCVGCGRCTASCTAGISIVEIVNRLVNDYDKKVAAMA
jgi:formate hydrogenlyase subunit 6/NADH:ubiquinone oxidoreductase subunit I